MEVQKTKFEGLWLLKPRIFKDHRGHFFESYNDQIFRDAGINIQFLQDNQSQSSFGTLRGLHFQKGAAAQTKLVRVVVGRIIDVAVDLRPGSPTFGQHYSHELSDENYFQLLVPKGFAHGFSVLSPTATVVYKCDALYDPKAESGIRYDDPDLNIDWGLGDHKPVVSAKDEKLPWLKEIKP